MSIFNSVTVSLGVLGIIIIAVNGTIAILMFKSKKYRNNNVYIIIGNIAVADILVGMATIGDSLLAFTGWSSMYSCTTVYSFIALSCMLSVCLLSTLATNQCYAIAQPIKHKKNFTVKRMNKTVGLIWVCCVTINITALLCNVTSKQEHFFPKEGCKITLSFDKQYVLCFCLFLIISLLFMVLTYTKIIQIVKRQAEIMVGCTGMNNERKRKKHEQTLRLTRKLIGVILIFLLCWMPFTISGLIWGTCPEVYIKRQIEIPRCVSEGTFTISAAFALIHSTLKFIFYLCTFKEFRKSLKKCCCYWKQNHTDGTDNGNTEQSYL